MFILSIDIGIKNLSLCIMSCLDKLNFQTYTIHVWENKELIPLYDISTTLSKQHYITQLVLQHITCFYTMHKHLIHEQVNYIYIEKQPKINNIMYIVSIVIYTKLIDLIHSENNNSTIKIEFIDARKKLQVSSYYTGPNIHTLQNTIMCTTKNKKNEIILKGKKAYTNRKKISIYYCTYFLSLFNELEKEKWSSFFEKTKKKDDLSDTFLYCIHSLSLN